MKRDEIIKAIYQLSLSQGFYGRLLRAIEDENNKEAVDEWLTMLEKQNFKEVLDLVMFLET